MCDWILTFYIRETYLSVYSGRSRGNVAIISDSRKSKRDS